MLMQIYVKIYVEHCFHILEVQSYTARKACTLPDSI